MCFWVKKGMFSHYPGEAGSTLQEAKEKSHRGPKWEESTEKGEGSTPNSSLLMQHWSIRTEWREAEVRWSMLLEASRERGLLGKDLWAQTPGITSTGSFLSVPRSSHWTGKQRWRQQPLPSPQLRETHSKASVEGRPLQDQPCSAPPARRNLLYSSRVPCKATPCNCAQRSPWKEKLQSKLNTDLEVITAFKKWGWGWRGWRWSLLVRIIQFLRKTPVIKLHCAWTRAWMNISCNIVPCAMVECLCAGKPQHDPGQRCPTGQPGQVSGPPPHHCPFISHGCQPSSGVYWEVLWAAALTC